ncbi:MAG TPA: NFACT family protein [Thermomicrobiales bacterium]|jgi:predicted ribosome quality control (RQC) complex YloA/Tae2 family protein
MYDALMLAAIVDELNDRVLDGKVQRVLLLDPLSIGLQIYSSSGRHQLLVSAGSSDARMHLVGEGESGGRLTGDATRVTPLLLLLRKYVRGARLVRIYQESPLERVAFLRFAKFIPHDLAYVEPESADDGADDDDIALDGDLVETTLAVEIMGRHSNLILTGSDGLIMDSAKRIPARISRVRQILPKLPYEPVPPQDKADPRTFSVEALRALLAENPNAQLQQLLVGALRGVSPQTARELAFRATGSARTKALAASERLAAVHQALDEIYAPLRTGAWLPSLYLRDPEAGSAENDGNATLAATPGSLPDNLPATIPVAFSPFPLFHLRELHEERLTSPSALVERYFGATARVQAHGQRKEALAAIINGERTRLTAREHGLQVEAQRAEEAERWRRWGEAIYAYAWSLEPGQRELIADDLVVPLESGRTPSENAQDYFERYRKAQSAAANLPALLDEVRNGLAYLDQLLTLLHLAERYEQIAAIDREWQEWRMQRQRPAHDTEGQGRKGQQKKGGKGKGPGPGKPQTLRARGGHQIFIGHTSAQNDAVTFDIGGPDDSWLHSRGVPGSHVIVKWSGGREDEAILQAAAELAAYYSGGRESGRVEVDHAARRDVRKIRGAGPGMVTYRNEHTVRVAPRSEDELRRVGLIE